MLIPLAKHTKVGWCESQGSMSRTLSPAAPAPQEAAMQKRMSSSPVWFLIDITTLKIPFLSY